MNIGQVAEATGLTTKAVRHYESLGLVVPSRHEANDYRQYSLQDVDDLRFLQRARAVGFSLEEAGQLLDFYRNPQRKSAEVHALVVEKMSKLDQQWLALNLMRQTLSKMATECAADDASDCAIINHLADKPVVNNMPFTLVEVSNE